VPELRNPSNPFSSSGGTAASFTSECSRRGTVPKFRMERRQNIGGGVRRYKAAAMIEARRIKNSSLSHVPTKMNLILWTK
jgi:hypothetical protein